MRLRIGHLGEERVEGLLVPTLAHPDDPAGEIVQYHGHVVVSLADGDLIDGQDTQVAVIRLAEFLLQKVLIDGFDGLGGQVEMASHVLDGHNLAQVVDQLRQSMRDSLAGVGEIKLLYPGMLASRTPHPAILDPQERLSRADVQIADEPAQAVRVNLSGLATFMTKRSASAVWLKANDGAGHVKVQVWLLINDFHACKRKIRCYTELGHRASPFGLQVPIEQALVYQRAA